MMEYGSFAVASVQRQIMLVQSARSHNMGDRHLDVYTYKPFAEGVFLASEVPQARIASKDLLTIFPPTDAFQQLASGMLELPPQAYSEYMELSSRGQQRAETLYAALMARRR
ncbi:hypothetical protein PUNSTDRAFT_73119 [Punctularia strigosozonata HHB-11173 SS5]|uniref:uncharacterized protein n=1 Tax=Punctularia strigosozonata (strain HHB-11173) TaxID=741275 RepID=UPI00044184B4|nr:uncharacterized protein PUNSTDRAFT_73119 [Punctularia strigosozonata HHB-11173 SS5]EIN06135.1 hypothetical protein PUNSTDRAFT_73119 [Punctularia strigosozonata HHB-11173 SS5]